MEQATIIYFALKPYIVITDILIVIVASYPLVKDHLELKIKAIWRAMGRAFKLIFTISLFLKLLGMFTCILFWPPLYSLVFELFWLDFFGLD